MPISQTWRDVADTLEGRLSGPTQQQRDLSRKLDIVLPQAPAHVAEVLLRQGLAEPLGIPISGSDDDLEYLNEFERRHNLPTTEALVSDTKEERSAWWRAAYDRLTVRGLRNIKPEPGDILCLSEGDASFEGIVSSVSANGKVNFRGRPVRRAWPNTLSVALRVGDAGYEERLRRIEGDIANREVRFSSNAAALNDLKPHKVDERIPPSEALRQLEELLDTSGAEREYQALIQRYPSLIAGVVFGSWDTYVLPEVRFGAHYRADFLVLGMNSAGPEWVLVELERADHRLHVEKGRRLSGEVRHGIDQIADWRSWLDDNVGEARRRRRDNGLGLYGINSSARGIVVVGRGDESTEVDAPRERQRTETKTEVRTYDWLLREARALHPESRGFSDLSIVNR